MGLYEDYIAGNLTLEQLVTAAGGSVPASSGEEGFYGNVARMNLLLQALLTAPGIGESGGGGSVPPNSATYPVKNTGGVDISTAPAFLRITGFNTTEEVFEVAAANGNANLRYRFCHLVSSAALPDGATGTAYGPLSVLGGFNFYGLSVGQPIWLSGFSGWTATAPTDPSTKERQLLGFVLTATGGTEGKLLFAPQLDIGYTLGETVGQELVSPASVTELQNQVQILAMRNLIYTGDPAENLSDAIVDAFTAEAGNSGTAVSAVSGLVYDAAGDFYEPGETIVAEQAAVSTQSALGNQNGTQISHGQRIRFAADTKVSSVAFSLGGNNGDPLSYAGLRVRVETDNAGSPSGNLLDTNTFGEVAAPQQNGWNEFVLNSAATCLAGVDYWLVVETIVPIAASNVYYILNISQTAGSYPNGYKATRNGSVWNLNADWDATFFVMSSEALSELVLDITGLGAPNFVRSYLLVDDRVDGLVAGSNLSFEAARDGSLVAGLPELVEVLADGKKLFRSAWVDLSAQGGGDITGAWSLDNDGQSYGLHAASLVWSEVV